MHRSTKFSKIGQAADWGVHRPIIGAFLHFLTSVKIIGGMGEIFESIFRLIIYTLPMHVRDFRYVAPFRN